MGDRRRSIRLSRSMSDLTVPIMDNISGMSPPPSPLESRDSSPLSMRSKSPTPPYEYPSPTSSQPFDSRSSSKSREVRAADDGSPPAKKRKFNQPKERTTGYLDLRFDESPGTEQAANDSMQLERLFKVLRTKRKIVVIAGAGISVSAGIPDFRSSTGLFTTLRSQHNLKSSGKHLFDAAVYKTDSSTASFHDMVREMSHMTRQAEPTLFHHMLASLAEEGRLLRLYTQNVDGIDTSLEPLRTTTPLNSRGPWPKTVQLHGGLEKMVCTKCRELSDFDGSLFEGSEPPCCKACEAMDEVRTNIAGKRSHGIGRLRPRIVLYNEYNPDEEAIGAVTTADLKSRPDAVIVVGTSLKVPGVRRIAREMCQVARGRKDGFTAWINNASEPGGPEFKDCWDLVIRGDCDEVARQAAIPRWDDKDIGAYSNVTGQEIGKSIYKVEVEDGSIKHNAVETTQGMVTPTASPRTRSPAPIKDIKKLKQPKLFPTAAATTTKATKATSTTAATTTKATKATPTAAKKKSGRKPAVAKPANKITNAFTSTKSSKPNSGKPIKQEKAALTPILAPLFPNLVKPDSPMQPLSPAEIRNNSEASCQYGLRTEIPGSPDSPSGQLQKESERGRQTIQQTQILPKNMAYLLGA